MSIEVNEFEYVPGKNDAEYIELLKGIIEMQKDTIGKAVAKIKKLSAQPEQKHGKWNCGDDMFEYAICSSCRWDSGEAWEYVKNHFNFCPNCGAMMEEVEQ